MLLVRTSEPKYIELYGESALEAGQPGNLNGAQVRVVQLGKLIGALPKTIQDELNEILGRD